MWEAKSAGSVLGRQQDREEVRQARHPRVQSVRKCPSSGPLSAPPPRFCILGTSLAPVGSRLQALVSALPHPTDFCDWETAAPTWLTLQPSALELTGLGSPP